MKCICCVEDCAIIGTHCGWCRNGQQGQEPGAHHAADCTLYRSDTTGPDQAYWAAKFREFFRARRAA